MSRRLLLLLALLAGLGSTAAAQATRASLLQQATAASDNFETERAIDLARAALNPALGPLDSSWVRSVHLITQLLFENGNEPDARTWARWGMRLNPQMPIDSVNTLSGVVAMLRQARDSAGIRTSGDQLAQNTWQWPPLGSRTAQGTLRLDPSPMSVPLNVTVSNSTGTPVGQLLAGPGLALAPGTYEISVAASGFVPATVRREVLPGVTLTLAFQLAPSVLISGTISTAAREAVYRGTAAITVTRHGASAPICVAGAVASPRFLLTSYSAIRGAEGLAPFIGGTAVAGEVRVAAYDPAADIAVLYLPAARPDTIAIAAQLIDRQAVWGVGITGCRVLSDSRSSIDEWTQRPLGALRLSDPVTNPLPGAPVVDYLGRLAGVWTAATSAVPAPNAAALLDQARRNVASNQTFTVGDVARRENHIFGSVAVTADVPNATVRLTPLERWHWSELAASGVAPFNFAGPVGRYRLETTAPGLPARTQEITLRPGETVRVAVPLRVVAQGGGAPQPVAKKGGIPKWVWFAVIGAGGAAAAAMGGGGGGGSSGPSTGGIIISVPNP